MYSCGFFKKMKIKITVFIFYFKKKEARIPMCTKYPLDFISILSIKGVFKAKIAQTGLKKGAAHATWYQVKMPKQAAETSRPAPSQSNLRTVVVPRIPEVVVLLRLPLHRRPPPAPTNSRRAT
jgi:hypothetical protein